MPIQRFKISLTCRGAIFKAKRWFYATFYSRMPEEVREGNKRVWAEFARRIIEEVNGRGVADKPARIIIEYDVGSGGEFRPLSALIEVYELKSFGSFKVPAPGAEVRARLASELEGLLKRAEEHGLTIEDLLRALKIQP
ncbi:hypothetical protein [Thermofilum sp.]|uniref:hypothetical protein n=1 Tax=Thermofilum sp. TaxID=1961369 RepID=UPI0031644865